MADWQEIAQSLILGFVFAYMATKLFSLLSSFRDDNLRVQRGDDVVAPLVASSGDQDLASADEQNVPESAEELEAAGEDTQEDRAVDSSFSSSDPEAEISPALHIRDIDGTDVTSLPEATTEKEGEEDMEVVADDKTDVGKKDLDGGVLVTDEHH